jgi:ribonuclease P protein component
MSDEAHLPAEQSRASTPPRLSRAHGDGRRPQGSERASRAGPQAPVGLKGDIRAALGKVTRRADYLAANQALRAPSPGFVLLVRPRGDGDKAMRVGITVSGRVGGAVVRNRMKRRFRELARAVLPEFGIEGADHILIGRSQGIEREWALLDHDLKKSLAKIARRLS